MKKVLGAIAGLVFGLFGIGVIGLMISLTYGALQRIFPGNFQNQMWGLVIYDIATLAWGLAFVFKSNSLGQYAAAGAGFLTGLIGTLGMIAAEVILSGQVLTGGTVDTSQIGQWMVYGFIASTALHVILVYMHHGTAPDIAQKVGTGVARSQILDKARADAERQLEKETPQLARDLTADIVESVRRDLSLPIPVDGTLFDRRRAALSPGTIPHPTQDYTGIAPEAYPAGTRFADPADQARADAYHAQTKEAGETPSPFRKSEPDSEPSETPSAAA